MSKVFMLEMGSGIGRLEHRLVGVGRDKRWIKVRLKGLKLAAMETVDMRLELAYV